MAVKLSDLTTESAPASTDILAIADPTTGVMRKITVQALKDYMDTLSGLTQLSTPTLTATVISSTQIDLSWTNVANESSYRLEWSPNGSTGWTQIGGTIAANTTTYNHTGLTPSTLYYYRLKAVGDGVTYTDSGYGTDNDTTSAGGSGYQTESDAFFAVNTGLTTTEKDAVDDLVIALKAIGWSKFQAIYPVVGGSAAAHKWNLANPADTDGAFRLTFAGTVTHNASGMTGNGSTGYADTKFVPSSNFASFGSAHFAICTSAGTNNGRHGCTSAGGTNDMLISPSLSSTSYYRMFGATGQDQITVSNTDFSDLFSMVRRGTTGPDMEAYKGSTSVGNALSGSASDTRPSTSCYLLAQNDGGTANYFTDHTVQFACLGTALTDAEITSLSSAVATYNTALSR